MLTTIFCYGTLKKGYWNNILLEKAQFIGNAKTVNHYTMYSNGSFPYVSYIEDEVSYPIHGEVYNVTPEELERVDILEGHPSFYTRKPVLVELESGEQLIAEIYFNNKPHGIKLKTGIFQ